MNFRSTLIALALSLPTSGFAIPTLQLDIVGGTYVGGSEESMVANSDVFTLRALLKASNGPTNPYFISMAVQPMAAQNPVPTFGSFSVAGTASAPTFTLSLEDTTHSSATLAAANMLYGTAPLDVPDDMPGIKDLAPHGVFPTYYAEIKFDFSPTKTVAAYNIQDDSAGPGLLYYADFTINTLGLVPGYYLHFDLYDERVKNGTYTIDDFAPFSHDARSQTRVPDGGPSALMIGGVLLMVAALRRKS